MCWPAHGNSRWKWTSSFHVASSYRTPWQDTEGYFLFVTTAWMPFCLSTLSSGTRRRKVGFLQHVAQAGSHIFIDWGRFIPWLLQVTSVRETTDVYSLKASPSPHCDGFFSWHSNHSSGLLLGSTGSGCCILSILLSCKMSVCLAFCG